MIKRLFINISFALLFFNFARASNYLVTSIDDTGVGTFRAALTDANLKPGLDTISFAFSGIGVHSITLNSALPNISDPIFINGFSQIGSQPNFADNSSNAILLIEINGNNLGIVGFDFVNGSAGSTISGIVMNRFSGSAIRMQSGSGNNIVSGCYVGVDPSGSTISGNGNGIEIYSSNNVIGGLYDNSRLNIFSGNPNNPAILLSGADCHDNSILFNFIGMHRNGSTIIGGNEVGILAENGVHNILIGDAGGGSANRIVGCVNQGISVIGSNTTGINNFGNKIYNNGGISFDLNGDGTTPNDVGDTDSGPNELLNYPTIVRASTDELGAYYVGLNFQGAPYTEYRFDFYYSGAVSGGFDQRHWLGRVWESLDANGVLDRDFTTGNWPEYNAGDYIVVTVTDENNLSSSESSDSFPLTLAKLEVSNTSDNLNGDTSSVLALIDNPGPDGISLREAILAANNQNTSWGQNNILFNIPGPGPHIIQPTSCLPQLRTQIYISGWTEPDWSGAPLVSLDGSLAGNCNGIDIDYQWCTVTGLSIVNFEGHGIYGHANYATIEAVYVGVLENGVSSEGNNGYGIYIDNAEDCIIGGDNGERSIVSANAQGGVCFSGSNTTGCELKNTYVGTDVNAAFQLGTQEHGVHIVNNARQITLGSLNSDERNVISGNSIHGILIDAGCSTVEVIGNFIGINQTGDAPLANGGDGIHLSNSFENRITNNVLSGNLDEGIEINGSSAYGNVVQGNHIGIATNGIASLANGDDGLAMRAGAHDNVIGGGNSIARNLISFNNDQGILIENSPSNTVSGNYIGTDITGTLDCGNVENGILILEAAQNTIGGSTSSEGNLISGNDNAGIRISGAGSTTNTISANIMGLDLSGNSLGQAFQGVVIDTGANNNTIGGVNAADRNVISGHDVKGIHLMDPTTHSNFILGNYIGTSLDGNAARPNGDDGIAIDFSHSNVIRNNVISGNGASGVDFLGASAVNNLVENNRIGIGADGISDVGNIRRGITLDSSPNNTIGSPGAGNVISFNDEHGLYIDGSDNIVLQANFIGTDQSGTLDCGNGNDGISLFNSDNLLIGGTSASGNLVSGNEIDGIRISESIGVNVKGNKIGTDFNGTDPLGNSNYGVLIIGSSANTVIGTDSDGTNDTDETNIISGNNVGVVISNTSDVSVMGNHIGADVTGNAALPNTVRGLAIESASTNILIGTNGNGINDENEGNIIGGNNGEGLLIDNSSSNLIAGNNFGLGADGSSAIPNTNVSLFISGNSSDNIIGFHAGMSNSDETVVGNRFHYGASKAIVLNGSGVQNRISRNSFLDNAGIGIDLSNEGATSNDVNDSDGGPNERLNFPVIESATILNNMLTISGFATPNAEIEFYAADAGPNPNPNPYSESFGEGERFLFTVVEGSGDDTDATTGTYTEDGTGSGLSISQNRFEAEVDVTGMGLSGTDRLTALAIASNNNTSEFSQAFSLSTVEICGNGVDDDGDGFIDCEDPDCDASVDCPDDDGDGVNNLLDLDLDNDGILNSIEQACPAFSALALTGTVNSTSISGTAGGFWPNAAVSCNFSWELVGSNPGTTPAWGSGITVQNNGGIQPDGNYLNLQPTHAELSNGDYAEYTIDFSHTVLNAQFKLGGLDNDDEIEIYSYFNGALVTSQVTDVNIGSGDIEYTPNGVISSAGSSNAPNNSVLISVASVVDQIVIRSGKAAGSIHTANTNTIQLYELDYCIATDTDTDGIPDYLDLDSDNDGIYDVVEAGGSDPDNDGVIGTGAISDTNVNGWSDITDNTNGGTVLPDTNSDGSGLPDRLELDSDNDGCFDVLEAGFTDDNYDGILGPNPVTVDSDGLVTSGSNGYTGTTSFVTNSALQSGCADNDNDGISDENDLDDDNDGLRDEDEYAGFGPNPLTGAITTFTTSVSGVDLQDDSEPHLLQSITIGGTTYNDFVVPDNFITHYSLNNPNTLRIYENDTEVTSFAASGQAGFEALALTAFRDRNLSHYQALDWGNDWSDGDNYDITYDSPIITSNELFLAVTERNGNNPKVIEVLDVFGNVIAGPTDIPVSDYVDLGVRVFDLSSPQNAFMALYPLTDFVPPGALIGGFRVSFGPGSSGDGPDGKVFVFGNQDLVALDLDQDGIPNHHDLDSDADGIYDLIESGHSETDADQDGRIDGPISSFGSNGLFNSIETAPESGLLNYSILDSDSDGITNFRDLDSDGDGCNDVLEAGYTDDDQDGKLGSSPVTVNINGVVTSGSDGYTGTTSFVTNSALQSGCADNDNDGVSNYNDLDDDNDGILDTDECQGTAVVDGAHSVNSHTSTEILTTTADNLNYALQTINGITVNTSLAPALSNSSGGSSISQFNGSQTLMWVEVNTDRTIDNHGTLTITFPYVVQDPIVSFSGIAGHVHSPRWSVTLELMNQDVDMVLVESDSDTYLDGKVLKANQNSGTNGNGKVALYGFVQELTFRLGHLSSTDEDGPVRFGINTLYNTCDDPDGDLISSVIDLDSDNDGIYDVVEAGGSDPDNDGIIGTGAITDTNGNGWSDIADNTNGGTMLLDTDSDSDGTPDRLELDSDNDGCTDVTEAGFTDPNSDGLLGPNPVLVNTSGVVTSGSNGYTEPISTNGSDYDFQVDGSPLITNCPANQNTNGDVNCQAVLGDFRSDPTVSGACFTVTQSPAPGSTISGNTTVTLTAEDSNGDTDNCTFIVSVLDVTDPVVTCPGNQTEAVNASCELILPDYTSLASATDNCSSVANITITQSPAAGTTVTGNTTVTLTAEDEAGNTDSCTFNVTVSDTTDPVVTCPGNQTEAVNASCELVLPDYTSLASATDNCSSVANITITQSPAAGTSVTGNTTVTLTAEDEAGNTDSCTFNVTVSDTTDPVVTCPGNQTEAVNASCELVLPDYTSLASATDNCSSVANITITQSPAAGTTVTGNTTVTLTAEDEAGNTDSCTFNVTVSDTTDPVVTCPGNQTEAVNASCELVLPDYTSLASATDNCSSVANISITQSPVAGTTVTGNTTVTLTAEDEAGNTDSCTFNVTVSDTTDPVVTCPGNQTEAVNASCELVLPDYTSLASATDNCSSVANITITQSPAAGTTVTGNTTVTLTAEDEAGNTDSCTFNVTVSDTTDPVVTCPGNQTEALNASCELVLPDYTSLASATDNCSSVANITITQSPAAGTTVTGNTTVSLTAEDEAGNTDTCTFNVTISDTTDPTAVCQDITIQLDASGAATITGADIDNGSTDNCGVATLVADQTDFDCTHLGANTVTLTVTDAAGNTHTCTSTVTVEDNVDPTAVCQDFSINLDASGNAVVTAADVDNGSSDNCSVASVTLSGPGTYTAIGTYPEVLTVTDTEGNTSTCNTTITVGDVFGPTAVCQDITVQLDASGNVSIVATDVDGGSTDNGIIVSTVIDQTDFDCTHLGTNTVTLTVTDDSGLTGSCSATVTVEDSIDPVAVCQDITIQLDASGAATITGADIDNGSTDNCGVATLVADQTDFDCTHLGANTVTLTVTDAAGNTHTCTSTVTVEDNVDPTAVCQDFSINLDASGNAVVTAADVDNGSSDNCSVASVTLSGPGTYTAIGTYPEVLTVTDTEGNTSTCNTTITVGDVFGPTAVCQDITVQLDASGNVSIVATDVDGGSTDNGTIVSTVIDQTDFDCTHLGTNTVTLTVTDDSGLTGSCSATVTVEDSIDPVAVCQDITIQLDASGAATITGADIDNGSTDNCGVATLVADQTDFDCTHLGANTVTLTVTDAAGNTHTCTSTVTVEDNVDPTAVCQDFSINLDASGNAVVTAADVDNGSSDNCSVASVTLSGPGTYTAIGTYPEVLTVTDTEGNTSTCNTTITVGDVFGPTAVCQDITVQLDASGNVSIVATDVDGGSTDNGTIVSTVIDQTDFDCTHLGTNTVTLTVTDDSGLTGSCSATVTVEDSIDPVAVCQDITIQLDASGAATITGADIDNGSTDNCGVATLVADQTDFDCTHLGANTVTLTVTDAAGNTHTCTSTVTVEDNVDPTAVCQDFSINLDASGNAVVTAADIDNGSSDNCSVASVSLSGPGTYTAIGTYPEVLTVTDTEGNTSTCNTTITVGDVFGPTAVCQDITVQLDASGNVSIVATDVDGGSTDSGIIVSTVIDQTDFDCTHLGTNTVTLTVTDDSGLTGSCSATVTVEDSIAPIANCQDITIQLDASGAATITGADIDNGSTDNCGVATLVADQTDFDCTHLGANTVTLTVTDAAGNTHTCTSTVTVEDNVDPVAVCQNISVGLDLNGEATITTGDVDGGSTDNCTIATLTLSQTSFNSSDLGENTVTLTVTDSAGNTSTCDAVVTVEDTIPPTAICQNITISLDANGNVSIEAEDVDGGSIDNISISSFDIDVSEFGCENLGENTVVLTVTDSSGNTDTCEAIVTVIDDSSPNITECPTDVYSYLDANCEYLMEDFIDELEFFDNCTNYNEIVILQEPAPGTLFTGSQTVDCVITLSDAAGNSQECNFIMYVVDAVAPVIECPEEIIVQPNTGCSYEVPSLLEMVNVNDACSSDLTVVQTPEIGTLITESTVVTLEVTDETGNTTTCEFTLEFVNDVPPTVDCLPNQVIDLSSECVAILPDYIEDLNAQASCSSTLVSVTQTPEPGVELTESTVVTLVATDSEGNFTSCEFTVNIWNVTPPVIECMESQEVEVLFACEAEVPNYASDMVITAQCGSSVVSVIQNPAPGTVVFEDQIIVVTAEDVEGNVSTCEFEMNLVDNISPVIECQEDIIQFDSLVVYDLPEYSDNCTAELTLTSGFNSGEVFPHGYTTVSYMAEDAFGNADSCSFSVLVNNEPVAVNDTLIIGGDVTFFTDSVMVNDYDLDGDIITVTSFFNTNDSLLVNISEEGIIEIDILNGWCGLDSVQYTVCDEFGFCDEAYVYVQVDCFNGIQIPEGFSPNGDGVNDVFEIVGIEYFPDNSIKVFNRWGRLIYEKKKYVNDWDGTPSSKGFNGNGRLPVGTYFILLDLGDRQDVIKSYIQIQY